MTEVIKKPSVYQNSRAVVFLFRRALSNIENLALEDSKSETEVARIIDLSVTISASLDAISDATISEDTGLIKFTARNLYGELGRRINEPLYHPISDILKTYRTYLMAIMKESPTL